ncbi:MAG: hypothetical protein GY707_14925 [Desulfobacteraceae bacterium]|nr:hypothetical protein [Desulfobacteraceae bacterium]
MAKKLVLLMVLSLGICLASSFSSISMADDGRHNDKTMVIKTQQAKSPSAKGATSFDGVDGEAKSRKMFKGSKTRTLKSATSFDGVDGEAQSGKIANPKKTGE